MNGSHLNFTFANEKLIIFSEQFYNYWRWEVYQHEKKASTITLLFNHQIINKFRQHHFDMMQYLFVSLNKLKQIDLFSGNGTNIAYEFFVQASATPCLILAMNNVSRISNSNVHLINMLTELDEKINNELFAESIVQIMFNKLANFVYQAFIVGFISISLSICLFAIMMAKDVKFDLGFVIEKLALINENIKSLSKELLRKWIKAQKYVTWQFSIYQKKNKCVLCKKTK